MSWCRSGGERSQHSSGSDFQTVEHSVQSTSEWYWLSAGRSSRQGNVPWWAGRGQRRRT